MNTTIEHEAIDLRKVLAEIDNLRAATLKMQSDTQTQLDERDRMRAQADEARAKAKWYPVWVGAAIFGTGGAFIAALVQLLK